MSAAPSIPREGRAPAGHGAHADLDITSAGPVARERTRQVARIGSNLDQTARLAYAYASASKVSCGMAVGCALIAAAAVHPAAVVSCGAS